MPEESEEISDDPIDWIANAVSKLDYDESEAEKLYQPFNRSGTLQQPLLPGRPSTESIHAAYSSPPSSSSSTTNIPSSSSIPGSASSYQSSFSKQSTLTPLATRPQSAGSIPPLSVSPSSPEHSPSRSIHRARSGTEGSAHGSVMSTQTSDSGHIAPPVAPSSAQPYLKIVLTSDRKSIAAGTLEGFVRVMISSNTRKFRSNNYHVDSNMRHLQQLYIRSSDESSSTVIAPSQVTRPSWKRSLMNTSLLARRM